MVCSRHHGGRARVIAYAAAVAACAADDGAGDANGPAAATTTAAGSGLGPSGTTDGVTTAVGDETQGTASGPDPTTDSGADSSGSTGGGVTPTELYNDGWFSGAMANFMGGFAMGECWGSTFVPAPEDYPFVVDATRMLVGGTDRGTAMFSLALWSVDATNQPNTELSSATVELTGTNADIDVVNFTVAGIESPVFTEGNFALVTCLLAHEGLPAIAADADGQVDAPDRNWIRLVNGDWTQSTALGVTGDWVMRAIILPAPR